MPPHASRRRDERQVKAECARMRDKGLNGLVCHCKLLHGVADARARRGVAKDHSGICNAAAQTFMK